MNLNSHVKQYIVRHSNQMNHICRQIKERLGVTYFTYHTISANGEYSVIVNRPDFAEYFSANKLYLDDPFLRHPNNFREGAVLWNSYGGARFKTEIIPSIKNKFDLEGLSFTLSAGKNSG